MFSDLIHRRSETEACEEQVVLDTLMHHLC